MSHDEVNPKFLRERLEQVLEALERIPSRFAGIRQPSDFKATPNGVDRLDSICMVLLAAGEELKKIDRDTQGQLFAAYPQINWRGAIGLRDVLAHGYFQIDPEQIYYICRDNIPGLIAALHQIRRDLERNS